jgi:DNA-binding SARP family transcriptional activator
MLGSFRILKRGIPVTLRPGGKVEQLFGLLAVQPRDGLAREEVLGMLWPSSDLPLAGQSLNTLVYSLHRTLGDALAGRPPVHRVDGRYRLNTDDGVRIDVMEFDAAVDVGDRSGRNGDVVGAMASYDTAVELYTGDLVAATDVRQLLERERLRARYLGVRARLADHQFAIGEYEGALRNALALLASDPCREDAHRMAMRCYVRVGQRAQALRQFAICRDVLALEFAATTEPATDDLFDLVRTAPERV